MPVEVKCPVCGDDGESDSRAAAYLGLLEPFGVDRCAGCGMRWQSPRPTDEEFELLYQTAYHSTAEPQIDWLSSYPAPPDAIRRSNESNRTFVEAQHEHYLSLLGRHLPSKGRLLEIGCSEGVLLSRAATAGWTVSGIEPSGDASERARKRGLDVRTGGYQEHLDQIPTPDAVFMGHVLEHLSDPASVAKRVFDALRPGGVFCLEVPNQFESWVDRLGSRRLRSGERRESSILSIHHVSFFGPKTLEMVLKQAGFEVSIESWSPPREGIAVRVIDRMASTAQNQGRFLQAVCVKP